MPALCGKRNEQTFKCCWLVLPALRHQADIRLKRRRTFPRCHNRRVVPRDKECLPTHNKYSKTNTHTNKKTLAGGSVGTGVAVATIHSARIAIVAINIRDAVARCRHFYHALTQRTTNAGRNGYTLGKLGCCKKPLGKSQRHTGQRACTSVLMHDVPSPEATLAGGQSGLLPSHNYVFLLDDLLRQEHMSLSPLANHSQTLRWQRDKQPNCSSPNRCHTSLDCRCIDPQCHTNLQRNRNSTKKLRN